MIRKSKNGCSSLRLDYGILRPFKDSFIYLEQDAQLVLLRGGGPLDERVPVQHRAGVVEAEVGQLFDCEVQAPAQQDKALEKGEVISIVI